MWLWKLVGWKSRNLMQCFCFLFQSLLRTLFGIPTIAAGCEALQHLAEMIPTFCYSYPGLEHMEEMKMSSLKLVLMYWLDELFDAGYVFFFHVVDAKKNIKCVFSPARHSDACRTTKAFVIPSWRNARPVKRRSWSWSSHETVARSLSNLGNASKTSFFFWGGGPRVVSVQNIEIVKIFFLYLCFFAHQSKTLCK